MKHYEIVATWDEEAGVYVAECEAIGLVTEAPTHEALIERLEELVPQLIVLNKVAQPGEGLSIGVVTRRSILAHAA